MVQLDVPAIQRLVVRQFSRTDNPVRQIARRTILSVKKLSGQNCPLYGVFRLTHYRS